MHFQHLKDPVHLLFQVAHAGLPLSVALLHLQVQVPHSSVLHPKLLLDLSGVQGLLRPKLLDPLPKRSQKLLLHRSSLCCFLRQTCIELSHRMPKLLCARHWSLAAPAQSGRRAGGGLLERSGPSCGF